MPRTRYYIVHFVPRIKVLPGIYIHVPSIMDARVGRSGAEAYSFCRLRAYRKSMLAQELISILLYIIIIYLMSKLNFSSCPSIYATSGEKIYE